MVDAKDFPLELNTHTGSNPVLTTKNKSMKNTNLKAIVGLVLAIVLVVVMGYILILINNI